MSTEEKTYFVRIAGPFTASHRVRAGVSISVESGYEGPLTKEQLQAIKADPLLAVSTSAPKDDGGASAAEAANLVEDAKAEAAKVTEAAEKSAAEVAAKAKEAADAQVAAAKTQAEKIVEAAKTDAQKITDAAKEAAAKANKPN